MEPATKIPTFDVVCKILPTFLPSLLKPFNIIIIKILDKGIKFIHHSAIKVQRIIPAYFYYFTLICEILAASFVGSSFCNSALKGAILVRTLSVYIIRAIHSMISTEI